MNKLLWIAPILLAANGGMLKPLDASVIPRGTRFTVRINESLDTRTTRPGERFTATLTRPVVVKGATVIPAGATFSGHVATSAPSGRMKGRAVIAVTLDSVRARGARHSVDTNHVQRVSSAHKKRNVALIGGGAGLGAAIGAIAGGGKGAAIGALAGGGAGTAGAAATGKKHVRIPAETLLTFRFDAPARL